MPCTKEAFSVAFDNGSLYRDSARQNLDFFSIDRPMWLRKIDSRPQLGALPNARGVATRICASVSTQSSRGPRRRAFMAAGYSFFSHLLEHNGDGGGGASPCKT